MASVQPTRGPASGSLVTVQGIGFDSTPGAYACIFYRSHPAGHSWLPYQSAHVVADFLSPREVICNTSGAWSGAGFSAGLTRVAVEHVVGDSAELVAPLDKWAVEAEIILPSAVAEHLYVGVYVSIGEEALLVTGMNTTTVVVLNLVRAKLGTQRREHAAGEVLHVYVPLSWGRAPSRVRTCASGHARLAHVAACSWRGAAAAIRWRVHCNASGGEEGAGACWRLRSRRAVGDADRTEDWLYWPGV